ncbi:MAG: DJ-1/PfpI family protein, partial [Candidatus Zixiibacteriota bacterium]
VIIYPEVEELDFVGFYEVMQSVKKIREDVQLSVEIVGTTAPINCANGLSVLPQQIYEDVLNFDVVMIPGGRGWKQLVKNKKLLYDLRDRVSRGKLVCSVCTGAFVLAEARLLENRQATTHWQYYKELKPYCLKVLQDRVVLDGNVITAGGVACSLDLGLKVVEMFFGSEMSAKITERLVIPSCNKSESIKYM